MANDQFARIIRFAKRTGDRLIVTDPEGREPVVIMSLDEYEALVEDALGPGDAPFSDGEEGMFEEDDEYGEAPTLEIIERAADDIPTIPAAEEPTAPEEQPRAAAPSPSARVEGTGSAERRDDPSEEQFYLEPL